VHAGEDRGGIDQPVQRLPAAPEAAHRAPRRGHRERDEKDEDGEARRDVGPFHDVGGELGPVEGLVHEQVPQEMHADVEEREEPEHAAEKVEFREARQHAKGRDRKRRQEQAQPPDAERVLDLLHGIRAERACGPRTRVAGFEPPDAEREPGSRQEAREEDGRLGVAPDERVRIH